MIKSLTYPEALQYIQQSAHEHESIAREQWMLGLEDEHGQPTTDEDYETIRYVRLDKGRQPRIFANKSEGEPYLTGEELTEADLEASDWYVVESV